MKVLAQKFVTPSILVVEALKKAVESNTATLLTALIPGNIDDTIVLKLRQTLPKVLQILRISDECLKLEAPDEIIFCAIKKLKEYTPEGKAATFHSIAALLSVYISDKKISWREAIHLSEEIFQQNKS